MQIYIDQNQLLQIMNYDDPFSLLWFFLIHGGWLVFLVSAAWGYYFLWREWKRREVLWNMPYTIFAIDIPKDNEQTVKAVEEIMDTLHGIKSAPTAKEDFILGFIQLWISFEIISIEGYVQFLIRAPKKFNDMIKSVVYAHYPEAEMTEVEDYMDIIPKNANDPDSKFKGFGMDFYLGAPAYRPIKTYMNFEHSMSQTYIDPLANILELMGKMGPGEFMGIMILARPVDAEDVIAAGKKQIEKTMGRAETVTKNLFDKMWDGAAKNVNYFTEEVLKIWGDLPSKDEKDLSMFQALTPGERSTIQNIEGKIYSYLWEARILSLYIAPKEKFLIGRALYGIQGIFRQFAFENQFKNKKTKADYLFKVDREKKNVQDFIRRFTHRNTFETIPLILSSAELASIYHFPDLNVKAPSLKRTESKTVQPPTQLPFETAVESKLFSEDKLVDEKIDKKEIIDLDLDNKYFESKFAKDKQEKNNATQEFLEDLRNENKMQPTNDILEETDEQKTEPPSNLPFVE